MLVGVEMAWGGVGVRVGNSPTCSHAASVTANKTRVIIRNQDCCFVMQVPRKTLMSKT
jgi:hypothetical protein